MNRTLAEKKVLKKLGIEDFRHLTKDKVITMASMLDRMEPEVAKKAIEQFPEFAKTVSEMVTEFRLTLDEGLEDNKESIKRCYDSCDMILASLQKELERDELSFEERKYIIDKMFEVSKLVCEKDTENKKFIATLVAAGAVVVGAATMLLNSALGGRTKIEANDIKKADNDYDDDDNDDDDDMRI